MLRNLVLFGCLAALFASAQVQQGTYKKIEADKEYLMKEKSILQILSHIHQKTIIPELKEIIENYDLEQNINNFNNIKSVRQLIKLNKMDGLMGPRKVFTPLYESHVRQAKIVFDVLYSAKDWDTFIKTAAWMRNNINDGLFIYAFYSVVLHRPDTQNLVLPPLYEICPHLFISSEAIQAAYNIRMESRIKKDRDVFVINTNYTQWMHSKNPELQISYLTEDVGFNFYHFMHHVSYPDWLQTEHFNMRNKRQGELFYYVHEQILARYKLERHANWMYPMKNFGFDEPEIIAYSPNLRYTNGQSVPIRPENIQLRDFDMAEIQRVRDIEYRIREAIAHGYIETMKRERRPLTVDNGTETLGRIIENANNIANSRYYGSFYKIILNLLGHVVDPYHQSDVPPSTLQHFHSMLRDPMYYRLYQRIHKLFTSFKKSLPPYSEESLEFPGVEIESVEVDKMMTFFETFDIDITNVVGVNEIDDDKMLKIIARQPRLNHKDFTFRIKINSIQDVKGMVQVYLAPKYDRMGMSEMSLSERKEYMILLDKFICRIKKGKTTIERSSKEFNTVTSDVVPYRLLLKKVEDALQGKSQFFINDKGHEYGFPNRLILPKGTKNGAPYVMYVVITPHQSSMSSEQVRGIKTFLTCGGDVLCLDPYPMGFPFDRDIVDNELKVPNIYMANVNIYHKKMETSTGDV